MSHHQQTSSASPKPLNSSLSARHVLDFADAALQAAVRQLPDDELTRLWELVSGQTVKNKDILEKILKEKSPFSNELRKGLLQHRVAQRLLRRNTAVQNTKPLLYPPPRSAGAVGDNDDPTRLAASLKTPSGAFDDALALSQGLINASFGYLFQLTPELQTINISNEFGSLVANLKPPQVSLTVVQPGPPLYYMNFDSIGQLTIIINKVPTTISTAGWVFVFAVNLTMSGVDPNSPQGQAIQKQIDNPGDYSISQLYTDFNTADITNPRFDLCNFNGYQWPPGTFLYFQMFILEWLTLAQSVQGGTLGYGWTTNNPAAAYPSAPSFPPTDLIFQCYPYYASGQSAPTEGLGPAGDNNMLLYLEMTGNAAPPKERAIQYSGNWTTPSIPASMCVSRDVFWTNFLLRNDSSGPLLTMMNQATWVEAVDCTASYGLECNFTWTIGVNHAHDSSFWAWTPKPAGNGWTWSQSQQKDAKDYSSPGCEADASVQTSTNNDITIVPGSNSVQVSGVTTAYFSCDSEVLWIDATSWGQVRNQWSFTIEAVSILNGGLQLQINIPASNQDLYIISTDSGGNWASAGDNLGDQANHFATWLGTWNIRQPAQQLQTLLNSTAKFFLPGAGTMFYKNPIYNNENDLIVEAQYNGASDWLGRQPVSAQFSAFR